MNPRAQPPAYKPQGGDQGAFPGDRELVARMSAGDDRALAQFYDRWCRPVYALVAHLVRDADDAEDVVEDTFWQAWRQASRYDSSRGEVSTWILTIARSRALDRVRSRRRLREEPLTPVPLADDVVIAVGGSMTDPLREAEATERRALVADALRSLPAEQRQVLELAYFGGMSQTEIAERTGQPLGTVKTRTRLAAQKLRTALSVLRDEAPGGRSAQ
jgi:RNA polymerase sigma-70 factor, ECF subfamily